MPPDETVPQISSWPAPRRAQHVGRHGDDLGLVLGGAGPQVGVQGIALGVERIHLVEEIDVRVVAVINGARSVAVLPTRFFAVLHLLHLAQNVVAFPTQPGRRE